MLRYCIASLLTIFLLSFLGLVPSVLVFQAFSLHDKNRPSTQCIPSPPQECPSSSPTAQPPPHPSPPSIIDCEPNPNELCFGNLSAHKIFFGASSVGVNYGRIADNLPDPKTVAQFVVSQGIGKVKIYDSNSAVLQAFAHTNVQLIIGLPNENLTTMAKDTSAAYNWVAKNVAAYYPATQITGIAVGNEVLSTEPTLVGDLLGAMNNLHSALVNMKLDGAVKVSTPHSLSVLSNSYPPSQGKFNDTYAATIIQPILNFLYTTGSYVMVNVYPFFAYKGNPAEVALNYALFQPTTQVKDPATNLQYSCLFDAQVDAFYSAMMAMNVQFKNLTIIVTETGWPTQGDQNELGSSIQNAALYNGNLVKHIMSGAGTPLKPNFAIETYLFALFNENKKPGPVSERNYGLFYPDMKQVYKLNFTTGEQSSNGGNGSPSQPKGGDAKYCLAKPGVSSNQLQAALDFACGPGGANCQPLQPGQACFEPNTLWAHASYAFNSYFQKNHRKQGTCFFGGNAVVNTSSPSSGSCKYPTQ
ncbi:hypothetical protein Mapa_011826 [Marchantia paleacea]|nr:hypothetical protein Mapa_011826 [Marchantia paleacea]